MRCNDCIRFIATFSFINALNVFSLSNKFIEHGRGFPLEWWMEYGRYVEQERVVPSRIAYGIWQ